MPGGDPTPFRPELGKAVIELLHAEQEFTRAYSLWIHAGGARRRDKRDDLDFWERRIEEARHEVQKWQAAPPPAEGQDDEEE